MSATVPGSHVDTARRRVPLAAHAHLFTVDVEEYFHAHAVGRGAPPHTWHAMPSRVEASTDRLLELLAKHETHGTFFMLGLVAERHPRLVRRIVEGGHEVASHGHGHQRVAPMNAETFRVDLRRSVRTLEDITGQRVLGFRAPGFSIVPGTEWAFDVLLEEGLVYDSSLFPIRRPGSSYPGCTPAPHYIVRAAGALLELPLATTVIAGMRLPAAGGAWLRHLPFGLVRRAFDEHARRGVPGTFYMHPWEIDAAQPVLGGLSWMARWRHYGGTSGMLARVDRLIAAHRFTSIQRALSHGPA